MSSNLPDTENRFLFSYSRSKIFIGLTLVVSLLTVIFLYWFFSWRWEESTDNAYIKADITPLSSKVNGYVKELNVTEGDEVQEGQVLAQIDPQEYQAHFDKARQDLQSAEATLKQLPTQLEIASLMLSQIDIKMESALANLEKDERAYERAKRLCKSDVSSIKDYDSARASYIQSKVAVKQLDVNKKVIMQNVELIKFNISKQEAVVNALKEQMKLTEIALNDTKIVAPISGVIGNRSIRKGQYVRTGGLLLSIVPLDSIWIVANYKETQIANFAKGQVVQFTVDAYPGKIFPGKILSINPASGAEFSLIPPENATGNFTKIVQRIPVKISIDTTNYRLVPGMSVSTTVCTKSA